MTEEIYNPPESVASRALISSMDQYREMYERSISDPDQFWSEEADKFTWFKKWDQVRDYNYDVRKGDIRIEWFKGATTNITVNCLDRHLEKRGDQTAILWEGNEPGDNRSLTYKQLHEEVCKFANVLKSHGVKKGDIQLLGVLSYAAPLLSTLVLVAVGIAAPSWALGVATLLITGGAAIAARASMKKSGGR